MWSKIDLKESNGDAVIRVAKLEFRIQKSKGDRLGKERCRKNWKEGYVLIPEVIHLL